MRFGPPECGQPPAMTGTLLPPNPTRRALVLPGGGRPSPRGPVMERIESTHSTWIFDTERMRFRRLPKGADTTTPSLESDWQPYFALDVDAASGAFTVALNEDRTRLLRAWRDDSAEAEPSTKELRLEPTGDGHTDG